VLSGTPDHRDMILSDDEKAASDTMMVCCSGSLGPTLVLDL
jgi:vanillate O-demethylase ferredoxin subunit